MNEYTTPCHLGEYRGHFFLTGARQEGDVWTGHYSLMGMSRREASDAAAAARHHWRPLEPGWATENEAETNACEAAHAAIDACFGCSPHEDSEV